MDAYWILPNREQHDVLQASDGARVFPLRQVLPPETRPDGFSRGVPTEILEKVRSGDRSRVLFAQRFAATERLRELFVVATPAGLDRSGRVVHLGLLFLLEPGESPRFELPVTALSDEDRRYAKELLARLRAHDRRDRWAASVHALLALDDRVGAATNVELERSPTRFVSLYALGRRGGLTSKRSRLIAINLALLAIVIAAISVRVQCCGAMPWPFN